MIVNYYAIKQKTRGLIVNHYAINSSFDSSNKMTRSIGIFNFDVEITRKWLCGVIILRLLKLN